MWGDVPTWVTAFAALAALVAARTAGRTAHRLYEIEVDRDRRRELAERRAQAELVAAWVSWADVPRVRTKLPGGKTSRAHLALRNVSQVPVYEAVVTFYAEGESLGSQPFHLISPSDVETHRESKCDGLADYLSRPRPSETRLDIRTSLTFTDASGVRWVRDEKGQLNEVVEHGEGCVPR